MDREHIIHIIQNKNILFDKNNYDYTNKENMESTAHLTRLIADRFHLNRNSEKNLNQIIEDTLARGVSITILAPTIYDIMENILELEKKELVEKMEENINLYTSKTVDG
jgi:hypothetical protein